MLNPITTVATNTLPNIIRVGMKERQILIQHISHLGGRGQGQENLSKFYVEQTLKIEVKLSSQSLYILVQLFRQNCIDR